MDGDNRDKPLRVVETTQMVNSRLRSCATDAWSTNLRVSFAAKSSLRKVGG
jgi:hypothetical protein